MRAIINIIFRYFNTLKYLYFKQFFFRILRLIPKKITKVLNEEIRLKTFNTSDWFRISNKSSFDGYSFSFLNEDKAFNEDIWNEKIENSLWEYNLHYLDFLNENEVKNKFDILMSWIAATDFGKGAAYDPYPTSLRVINIIKWCIQEKIDNKLIKDNLFLQLRWLNKNLEWHLMGNHLLANFKAIIFAGYFFDNPESKKWLKKTKEDLIEQLSFQILDDGGHCELSPMYQNILIQDLLDLREINSISKKDYDANFEELLDDYILKTINWSCYLSHPDDQISFFNDSSFNIASEAIELKKYAKKFLSFHEDNLRVKHLTSSGFIKILNENWSGILDVGDIGLDCNPGHAHADSLSFELSYKANRLFVNSGTSSYERSNLRSFQRSTAAHSTVEVNNENSSDVWDSFRVGKRARNKGVRIIDTNEQIKISSSHDGYKSLFSGHTHERQWEFTNSQFILKDVLLGKNVYAKSRFYLHYDIEIKNYNKDEIEIQLADNSRLSINIPENNFVIKDSFYYPEFGLAKKNKCIEIELKQNHSMISVTSI